MICLSLHNSKAIKIYICKIMELVKYTVEFKAKPYNRHPISNVMLDQYVDTIRKNSGQFQLHQDPYGSQDNGYVRFVHFFSDINLDRLRSLTKKYVEIKHYDFFIRGFRKKEEQDKTKMSGGGRIWKFLNEKF